MKIAEELEKIMESMCDSYCRWPLLIETENEDDTEELLLEKCAACPLNKL